MRATGGRLGIVLWLLLATPGCGSAGGGDPDAASSLDAAATDASGRIDDGGTGLDVAPASDAAAPDAPSTARPVVTVTTTPVSYTENALPVALDPALTVTDSDNMVASATVTLSPSIAGDALQVDNPASLIVTGIGTGTVTLTGNASPATYRTVLASIFFQTPGDAPSTTPRTATIIASDSVGPGPAASVTINVVAVNDPTDNRLPATLAAVVANPVAVAGVTVFDSDATTLSVTLTASAGTLTALAPSGGTRSGNATGTLNLTGPIAALHVSLGSLEYTGTATGTATVTMVSDDLGGSPAPAQTDTDTMTVTIGAGTPPTIDPGSVQATWMEDTAAVNAAPALSLTGGNLASAVVSIENPLPGDGLTITPRGAFTGANFSGIGTTTLTITRTGSFVEYQDQLRFVLFSSSSQNPGGTRSVRFTVTDPGALSASATRSLIAQGINDPPVLTAPASFDTVFQTPTTIPGLAIADVNAAGGMLELRLQMQVGRLTVPTPSGGSVTGNDSSNVTVTGTLAALNVALAGAQLRATSTLDTMIDVIALDNGNTPGPSLDDIEHIQVHVLTSAPPIVTTSPGGLTFTENGAPILIDDMVTVTATQSISVALILVTPNSALDTVTLTPNGPFQASDIVYQQSNGILVVSRDASAAEYTALLRTARWAAGGENPQTSAMLTFRVRDPFNQFGQSARQVSVTRVNDPPTVTVPVGTQGVSYGVAAALTGIGCADPDEAGTGVLAHVTSSQAARLTVTPQVATTVTGQGTTTLTISGPGVLVSMTLATLVVEPLVLGGLVLAIDVDDAGHTGAGGALSAAASVNLNAVAPTPPLVSTGPATSFTEGDAALVVDPALTVTSLANLASATISIVAPQAGDALALSASGSFAGADIAGSGTTTLTVTRRDSAAAYQALLRTLTFVTSSDAPGTARTVRFQVDNGLATALGDAVLTIVPVNDPPVNSVPAVRSALQGVAITFSGGNLISVTDVDVGGASMFCVLTPTGGTISVTATGGATVTPSGPAQRIDGTLTQLNATLATVSFTASGGAVGTQLVLQCNDAGFTDTDTISIGAFPSTCSTGTQDGHRYFACTGPLGWDAARSFCTDRAADLATIGSAPELNFLLGFGGAVTRWIGLADQLGEACFGWVDGTPAPPMSSGSAQSRPGAPCPGPGVLQFWDGAEPNNIGEEDCVWMTGSGTWNDASCGSTSAFVCEAPRD